MDSPPTGLLESLFSQCPELVVDQPARETYSLAGLFRSLPLIGRLLPSLDPKTRLANDLVVQQKKATTYRKWHEISLKLDDILGHNTWKLDPQSNLYDYYLVYNNLEEMRNARLAKDYKLLLYLVRTKWIRNLGNMGDADLYRHSHVGTKKLIEEYTEECKLALEYLINGNDVNLDDRYLLGMLIQTRKNIGRTALVLSGGSTFGVSHIGVLATLLEANLLPRIVSGSSAGSIMASILCCHTNSEVAYLLSTITERQFIIFATSGYEYPTQFKRSLASIGHFLKYGTLFDTDGLQETMVNFVGDLTFREAYNRTGKILNITVSPASVHEQTRLLNYLTAPNCLIWSAVCASCSLPGIFPSTSIYEKNPKTNEIHEWNNDISMKYVDGSVDNDLPIARLLEMFNVDHIIAVQVNPHVLPILKISGSSVGSDIENELNNRLKVLMNNSYDFVTHEIIHYLQILDEMDIYKNLSKKAISLLSQNYSGDITILPDLNVMDFLKIFANPTREFLLDFIMRGARASWPKMTEINNHCGVEFALDKAITLLRGRLITSSSKLLPKPVGFSRTLDHSISGNNTNSYYTLVNSPVLNDKQQDFIEKVQGTLKSPRIIRHNTTSNSVSSAKTTPYKKKRNSLGSQSLSGDGRNIQKGKSTTSLTSMRQNFEQEPRPSLFGAMYESPATRGHTEGSNDVSKEKKEKNIRKARSSGNFQKNNSNEEITTLSKLKYLAERVPYHKENPYLDLPSAETEPDLRIQHQIEKEQPNLPKLLSNSLRSSYIGLNRLKDPSRSSHTSTHGSYSNSRSNSRNNSMNNSRSNSHYNLKEYGSAEMIKNLTSPDIRRALTRSKTLDEHYGGYDFADDDGTSVETDVDAGNDSTPTATRIVKGNSNSGIEGASDKESTEEAGEENYENAAGTGNENENENDDDEDDDDDEDEDDEDEDDDEDDGNDENEEFVDGLEELIPLIPKTELHVEFKETH